MLPVFVTNSYSIVSILRNNSENDFIGKHFGNESNKIRKTLIRSKNTLKSMVLWRFYFATHLSPPSQGGDEIATSNTDFHHHSHSPHSL